MKKGFDIISILFWIAIVFYLDPGGFRSSEVGMQVDSVKNTLIQFGFVAFAWLCLFLKYSSTENSMIKDNSIKSFIIVLFIWFTYYFLWFYGLNNTSYPGPLRMILRNERMISQFLIVYPIVYFSSINLKHFVWIISLSTLVIMTMFLLSVFFNLDLVKLNLMQRGMGLKASRYFMYGYGIMLFTVPLALSLLIMKFKFNSILVLSALLVALQTFLSILRRDIVGLIEYAIIIAFIVNYINKSKPFNFLWRFINIKSLSFLILLTTIIISLSPDIIKTAQVVIETTYRQAILGDVSRGEGEDVRMSLTAQYGIVKAIEENLFLGTGYDLAWSTGDGGTKGFEGADYIFLAAFGMYGLVGLLIFLPFYIITVQLILRFIKLLRQNLNLIKQYDRVFIYPVIIGLAASAEFIKNIIEYPNWFFPIGAVSPSPKYFIYFGLLVGSYYQVIKYINYYKKRLYSE